jgi:hypothetical protein
VRRVALIIFAVGLSVGFAVTEVLFDNASFFGQRTLGMFLRDAPRRCSIQKLTGSKISDVAHQLNHVVQKTLLRQPEIQKKE